jgi:hypothetical protein
MPSEIISAHVEITSVGEDWYIARDGMVSAPIPVSDLSNFWPTATVSWTGGDFDDLWIQTRGETGWTNFFIWPASASGAALSSLMEPFVLDEMASNFTSVENIENPALTIGLRWVLRTGTSMPSEILIEGDFEWEHFYGQEPDEIPVSPYTMRTAEGDDVSDWEAAPYINWTADNASFAASIARAGEDLDVGAPYYHIAVYEREILTGTITGEYLGADRRFSMGI